MGKPAPIIGSAATINQQAATIRRQYKENAELVNLLARVLDDYDHHACITDETLHAVKTKHKEIMG